MIKLYWSPRSRSFSAIWLMEETGLPYERVLTDITTGAQKAPEYLAVNPMGKVPALKDGDAALGESAAICAYIADRYPETKLAPGVTDPLRAKYLQWMFFSPSCIEPALIQIFTKLEVPASTAALGQRHAGVRRAGCCPAKGPVDPRRKIFRRRHHDRLGAEFCGAACSRWCRRGRRSTPISTAAWRVRRSSARRRSRTGRNELDHSPFSASGRGIEMML